MSAHHFFYSSNLVNLSIPPQTKLLTFKKHSNISTLLFYIAKDINEYIYFCILTLQRVKYIQNELAESDGGAHMEIFLESAKAFNSAKPSISHLERSVILDMLM